MEGFCRGCLIKYDDPLELLLYTEKNRRLFVYATGLQVKRNDVFTFQLCKECYVNMKVACNFKKKCRSSDKKYKTFLGLKETDEDLDFCTFIKNNDDSYTFRLPFMNGNSTPSYGANKARDEDNESTCTSIRNFMSDILKVEDMPDTEAKIIKEVIEEEADILDDSLDSHWLQDDASIDTDFRLDFSFSPFCTPKSERCYTPKKDQYFQKLQHYCMINENPSTAETVVNKYSSKKVDTNNLDSCTIDRNLEVALNRNKKIIELEVLLKTPQENRMSGASTPTINNILFGKNLDMVTKVGKNIEPFENLQGDQELIDFLKEESDDELERKEEISNIIQEIQGGINEDIENRINVAMNDVEEEKNEPLENKYDLENFICKSCNKQYRTQHGLKTHFAKSHKVKLPLVSKTYEKKTSLCTYCGVNIKDSRNFNRHLKIHQKEADVLVCDKCNLTFELPCQLKMHRRVHLGNKKPILKQEKKFICNICGAASTTLFNLKIHQKRHTLDYKCFCNDCGKGFVRTSDLVCHLRNHTGEKPFKCTYCDKAFPRRDSLNSHIKKHLDKEYECETCHKQFVTKYKYKIHFKGNPECKQNK